jgi:nucleoside-triphosphatase THEP1
VFTQPRILALTGGSGAEAQALLATLAETWGRAGLRVAGAIQETTQPEPGKRETKELRDIATGTRYPILQHLGPGSTACCVDASGLAAACAAIEIAVRRGCDVVVISKFGKLEAERGGLLGAFCAAVEMETPVVTSVSSGALDAWASFAGPLAAFVAPDPQAIEAWRLSLTRERPPASSAHA